MKNIKKLIAGAAALTLIFTAAPQSGLAGMSFLSPVLTCSAEETEPAGYDLTWTINDGELNIVGEGEMFDFTAPEDVPWSAYASQIKTITVVEDITSIGNYAFAMLENAENVSLPETLLSIGKGAFAGCTLLNKIEVPEATETFGDYALGYDYNHGLLEFTRKSDFVIKCIANSRAEYYCYDNEIEMDITGTWGVSEDDPFYEKGSGEWHIANGILTVSGEGSLSSFRGVFLDYQMMVTDVIIRPGITDGGECFIGADVKTISVPSTVTDTERMCLDAHGVENIYFADGIESIGDYACHGCENLKSILIPKSVKSIGSWALGYYSTATGTVMPEGYTIYGYAGTVAEEYAKEHNIIFVDITDNEQSGEWKSSDGSGTWKVVGSTAIIEGNGTFEGVPALEQFKNSIDNVEFYGVSAVSNAMWNYEFLREIKLGSSVETIGENAFIACTALKAVDLSSVKEIGYAAFYNCTELADVTIPSTVKTIGLGAFGKTNIQSLNIPDSVETIDTAFIDCTSLESVRIPASVTNMKSAFYNCTGLRTVYIEEGFNTSLTGAFQGCTSLETVSLPTSLENIDVLAFPECTALKAITIPEGVKTISSFAFNGCTALESVSIGKDVTEIKGAAFSDCTSLKSVKIPATVKTIGKKAFGYKRLTGEKIEDFKIIGYAGTDANRYADENEIPFEALTPQAGDISLDEKTTGADLIMFINRFLEHQDFNEAQMEAADVTGDGNVDLTDLATLKQFLVGDTVPGKLRELQKNTK